MTWDCESDKVKLNRNVFSIFRTTIESCCHRFRTSRTIGQYSLNHNHANEIDIGGARKRRCHHRRWILHLDFGYCTCKNDRRIIDSNGDWVKLMHENNDIIMASSFHFREARIRQGRSIHSGSRRSTSRSCSSIVARIRKSWRKCYSGSNFRYFQKDFAARAHLW